MRIYESRPHSLERGVLAEQGKVNRITRGGRTEQRVALRGGSGARCGDSDAGQCCAFERKVHAVSKN